MKVIRVRRVGNSNVVSIPKELEAAGFTPGTDVLLEQMGDGSLRLTRADDVRGWIRGIGRQVVAENREALEILAADDRGEVPTGV